jgi:hypothetical protein
LAEAAGEISFTATPEGTGVSCEATIVMERLNEHCDCRLGGDPSPLSRQVDEPRDGGSHA